MIQKLSRDAWYTKMNSDAGASATFSSRSLYIKHSIVCVLFSLLCILFFTACAVTPGPRAVKNADAHNNLGISYLKRGMLKEAYIEFQKALKLNPKNKEVLNNLGYVEATYGKYDEAISYYKRAISIDPDFSDAKNNIGVIYLDMENWDEAVKYFQSALSSPIYSTPEKAYANLGYAYYKSGDYQKAEDSVNEALILDPLFHRARYVLGLIYSGQDNEEAAIAEFKKAIGIMPDYIEAHFELAKTYFKSGKRNKALKHFMYVAEKDENIKRREEASEYIERLKY